jgi:hypothetical protein
MGGHGAALLLPRLLLWLLLLLRLLWLLLFLVAAAQAVWPVLVSQPGGLLLGVVLWGPHRSPFCGAQQLWSSCSPPVEPLGLLLLLLLVLLLLRLVHLPRPSVSAALL